MFDTIAQNRIARASLSSPCQGLGGCDPHRARAQRAEAEYNALRGKILIVKVRTHEILTGEQQKEFILLEEKQNKVREDNNKLATEITRLKVIVDAWENNPQQQAGVEGLAWGWWDRNIKGTWNKAFSCDTYTDREKEFNEKKLPLEKELSFLQGQLQTFEQRISVQNLQLMRKTLEDLEKQNSKNKDLIKSYTQRITDARNSYQANKDAQKLAFEREAQEAAAKEQAKATAKEQAKQTQTIILVGAAIVGGYLLFRKSPTKVNA